MRNRRFWGSSVLALFVALIAGAGLASHSVLAETSTSPSYQMTEAQFGTGSSLESCSDLYCARVSIGDDGKASSATAAEFGEVEYGEPMLQMIVESGESNLGNLTTERTGTKIMKVKIRNYLSDGYMLQIMGEPPKYENHTLNTSATIFESLPGTEQFGINLVANTIPEVGANPVLQPSEEDGTSLVQPTYNTPNVYKYVNGDTIATSQETSGGADFTITMIVNISNSTPAGQYAGDFSAVILPYY